MYVFSHENEVQYFYIETIICWSEMSEVCFSSFF